MGFGFGFGLSYLNEVKTAISNLSTPGHTHDEKILQEETEKVNDRILMLSFIAMSIPTIGAILTPGIEKSIKIMITHKALLTESKKPEKTSLILKLLQEILDLLIIKYPSDH